jgi:hypothetical protein
MKNATSGGPDHARHLGPLARGDWGDRAYLLDLRIRNLVADVADNPVVIANVFGVAPQNADLVSQVRDYMDRSVARGLAERAWNWHRREAGDSNHLDICGM